MAAMALSLDAAAEAFRKAMRDTVKGYSLWYLIQGVLLIAAGILAIIYPVLSSAAVVVLLYTWAPRQRAAWRPRSSLGGQGARKA